MKITKATIKSFIRKNEDKLYIQVKSKFDGMTDMVDTVKDNFSLVEKIDRNILNTMGMNGAWFVNDSRDYFGIYEDEDFKGYTISNCCGSFILAIKN